MLHVLPEPAAGIPLARLASIRRALSLIEDFSGGAEDDPGPIEVVETWPRRHASAAAMASIAACPWPEAR